MVKSKSTVRTQSASLFSPALCPWGVSEAGVDDEPGADMPIPSINDDMVQAVNMALHEPDDHPHQTTVLVLTE
jgi:hypothetical protein